MPDFSTGSPAEAAGSVWKSLSGSRHTLASMIGRALNQRLAPLQQRLREPLLAALAVLLPLMIFVIVPLHGAGVIHSQAYGIAAAFALIGAVLVMSGSVVAVAAMLIAFGLALAANLLPQPNPAHLDVHLYAIAWTTIGVALLWVVARTVFGPGHVTYHRVIGAIVLYLTIGVLFVGFFAIVGTLVPNAFSNIKMDDDPALASNLVYFSFVTLTSVGYGDILPVHPMARSLSNLEAIIGQLYPATLLARLVTLELQGE
jgi:Ion channel